MLAGVKPIIEEWTGQKIEPTSLYGIRVYKEGAVLATRKSYFPFPLLGILLISIITADVDRLPLVSSCIIQVAQVKEKTISSRYYFLNERISDRMSTSHGPLKSTITKGKAITSPWYQGTWFCMSRTQSYMDDHFL